MNGDDDYCTDNEEDVLVGDKLEGEGGNEWGYDKCKGSGGAVNTDLVGIGFVDLFEKK